MDPYRALCGLMIGNNAARLAHLGDCTQIPGLEIRVKLIETIKPDSPKDERREKARL
jgi:hypothetical protein